MKNCPKCGKEIDEKAILCVNCGASLKPKKPIFKKWWFWVIVVVVVIVVAGSAANSNTDNTSSNSSTHSQVSTQSKQEISYEAVDLQTMLDELSDNALKAEKTYQDKYVEVTGRIVNFDSDGDYISIEPVYADEWNFDMVMCYIKNEDQEQILLEKSKGDTVIIKGQITSVGEVLGYSINISEIV
ncbi:MAG: zinc-ribbon domain-containing protein [Acutalibacteraceae bacterium]